MCFFCIKRHDWGREEFIWVPSPGARRVTLQNYVMNVSLYSHAVFVFQSKRGHFTRGSQTMRQFRTSIVTFETELANFENDIALVTMILVSPCWKNCRRSNRHSLFILSLFFLKSVIVGVAFFSPWIIFALFTLWGRGIPTAYQTDRRGEKKKQTIGQKMGGGGGRFAPPPPGSAHWAQYSARYFARILEVLLAFTYLVWYGIVMVVVLLGVRGEATVHVVGY